MYKNKKVILLSSFFILSQTIYPFSVSSSDLQEKDIEFSFSVNDKDFFLPFIKEKENIYIDLESFLNYESIVYKKENNQITFEYNDKNIIIKNNSNLLNIEEENEEYNYPISSKQIHLVKEFYLPTNNLKTFIKDNKLYVPIDILENNKVFNKDILLNENDLTIRDKQSLVKNYNYEYAFDEIEDMTLEEGQTVSYVLIDESYNKLKVGTKVLPSPTTGFSIVKPKYGFGSDTKIYKPSKGSALLDGWESGKISIPYTKDKELIQKYMLLDLGLINGEHMFIDELGSVLKLDYSSDEYDIIINLSNNLFLEEKSETYRGKVILYEILSYYINDKKFINDIEKFLKNEIEYKDNFNEKELNEKVSIEQYHNNFSILIK